jgi:HEAT repeat protein
MPNTNIKRVGSLFARLFNVAPHELPRISLAWLLRFCFQVGFTIGWTMLTAILVSRLGIAYLPLLFVANAGLIILGTIFFSGIVHRYGKNKLIYGTVGSGVALLTIASLALSATENLTLFFGLALLAESIFFAQLNILLGLFIEKLFSPLESARAFPLIETSEYIGGITGGLLILGGLRFLHLEAAELIFLWIAALGLIVPILILFNRFRQKLPALELGTAKHEKVSPLKKIQEGGRHFKKIPFLFGLAFVVALQWASVTILNFQYTKALDTSLEPATSEQALHSAATAAEIHHEELLTHGLSKLHILFSLLALLTQLFLTSRVIGKLGVVRALRLHPFVTIFTTLGLTFKFGLPSAVVAKAGFESTSGIYNSAYHSSFYSLRESIREHAKELLEGLVRPLGVCLGTSLLLALQFVFTGNTLTLAINLTLLLSALAMSYWLWRTQKHFTKVSERNLELPGNHPAKFDSLEILAQPGHRHSAMILTKKLSDQHEPELLREKILKTLGRLQDPTTIPAILDCFADQSDTIKLAAVNALAEFKNLSKHLFAQAFTQHRITEALKQLFVRENSSEIRSAIIRVFAHMQEPAVVSFLLQELRLASPEVQADCIQACSEFHDPAIAYYLEPYLKSENPLLQAKAISALWQFPEHRLGLTLLLGELLESPDKATQKLVIQTLGEIGALQEKKRLLQQLEAEDDELRLLAALALAKFQHPAAPAILADYLLHSDIDLAKFSKKELKKIPSKLQRQVEKIVHQRLSQKLHTVLISAELAETGQFSEELLHKLRRLYALADDFPEVAKIDAVLAGESYD